MIRLNKESEVVNLLKSAGVTHPALERIQKIKEGLQMFIDRNTTDEDPVIALKNFAQELKDFVSKI